MLEKDSECDGVLIPRRHDIVNHVGQAVVVTILEVDVVRNAVIVFQPSVKLILHGRNISVEHAPAAEIVIVSATCKPKADKSEKKGCE